MVEMYFWFWRSLQKNKSALTCKSQVSLEMKSWLKAIFQSPSLMFILSCALFQIKASVGPDSTHDTTITMNLQHRYSFRIVLLTPAYAVNMRVWLDLLIVWMKWIQSYHLLDFAALKSLTSLLLLWRYELFLLVVIVSLISMWVSLNLDSYYVLLFLSHCSFNICATCVLCKCPHLFPIQFVFQLWRTFNLSSQTSLSNANEELERWKLAFINHSILPPGIAPGVHSVGLTLSFSSNEEFAIT